MEVFEAYVPMDRRHALARSQALPDRTHGAALFADISGFTPLAEALRRTLGARRGSEELTVHLNSVYQALIQEVDRYRGSVIAFAGDAITCWFEGDEGWKATTCALAMQATMAQFSRVALANGELASLAMKVGIAAGPARRFLVGSPEIQILDVLAGQTLAQMAAAAHLASRGEVILHPELAAGLAEALDVVEWRKDPTTSLQYAVVTACRGVAILSPWPSLPKLEEAVIRPWLIRPVYERLHAGQGEFLTELRPAVALFLKFEGIDYDVDASAGEKLSSYVRWVQEVMARYEGFLIDVAMGDKGSYLYGCFGAPIAHENDAWRALTAADELLRPPAHLQFICQIQIGLSSGTMRTGAYGGSSRRTYGVLGDDVNLAARLMEQAAPGKVLVSERVQRAVRELFRWEPRAPLKLKGKSEPVAVFGLLGTKTPPGCGLMEPAYALPMVGRESELVAIARQVETVVRNRGQVAMISGEAGMGKSRLVAEALRLANQSGLKPYGGQCQSFGTRTSYLVWWSIWRGIFGLDSKLAAGEQIAVLERRLAEIDPALLPRLPLLGAVLNLAIPENDVTTHLEAKLRKSSLESLVVDCLRHCAGRQPLLLVLEDCHWIDPISQELLEIVAQASARLPVFILMTRRPPESGAPQTPVLAKLPYFAELKLANFTNAEAERLLRLKVRHLFGEEQTAPDSLAAKLIERAEGNPFFLDEVLNYLHDQNVDLQDPEALAKVELPNSLHSLVLSRIDRLGESQKTTLKVASVIGRLFPAAAVWGVSNPSDTSQVSADLEAIRQKDLTALDRPEPELTYIFKHIVTQEVTYESLPHALRSKLHSEIGLCLEGLYSDRLEQQVDLLAFHFDRSLNSDKKREYLQKAGEAAQAHYANSSAISYYERVLPLLPASERVSTLLKLGKVQELTGEWKKAGASYQRAFETAEDLGDLRGQAMCQAATGDLLRKQGMFAEANDWLNLAQTRFREIGDLAGVGQALHAAGTVAAMQGIYEQAKLFYEQSLALRQQLGDKPQTASLLSNLGIIARFSGDYATARSLMEQSLELRREVGDRWAIANSLNNLGVVSRDLGDCSRARSLLEESLILNRQVGDRWAIANTLSSLGEVSIDQQDWPAAGDFLRQSLEINLELGDRTAVAFILECFGMMAAAQSKPSDALRLVAAAAALRDAIGSPLSPGEQSRLGKYLQPAREALSAEEQALVGAAGAAMKFEEAVAAVSGH